MSGWTACVCVVVRVAVFDYRIKRCLPSGQYLLEEDSRGMRITDWNGEVSMFEYDQEIVQHLLNDNHNFQELYRKHTELKEKVRDAELGVLPLDDYTLGTMKKEKLLAKDKMAVMIESYRRQQ